MERLITFQNLREYAYVNDEICVKPVKGIVLSFFGLGCTQMIQEPGEEAKRPPVAWRKRCSLFHRCI